MQTTTPKPAPPSWYLVDASSLPLGRLATRIAHVLRGKHKPTWTPHAVHGDHVIVINVAKIFLKGEKQKGKVYIRHSGYLGHLRRIPFEQLLKENPQKILTQAVRGMLPGNKLRARMLQQLHLYAGPEHPHAAQKPLPLEQLQSHFAGRHSYRTPPSPNTP